MTNVQPQARAPQAAPQQAPAGAPAPAPLTNGLRGIMPDKFDGDRTRTNTFLQEFNILWNMNENNEMFQSPYLRINLALSLIRGPNVDDWVQAQIEELCRRLALGGGFTRDQEALWTDFRNTLTTAFTNTTERQRAVTALHDLKMKRDDLDTYVARFCALARKAGHPLDNLGTMDNFARGLKKGLLTAILTRQNQVPTTFQEWVTAATDEEQKFTTLISYTSAAPWTKWNTPPSQQNRQPEQPSNNQYVPMQIRAIRKVTTEDEKAQHKQEGHCFECSRQGHLANKCPYKKKNKVLKPQSDPLDEYLKTARHELAEEEEEDEEEEPHTEMQTLDLSIKSIATRTASFSPEEREAWVHAMQSLGVDFQEA